MTGFANRPKRKADEHLIPRAEFTAKATKAAGEPAAPVPYDLGQHVEPVSKLLKREIKPVRYIFNGLLARGASSLLAGPPKGFKTTFALWMALVAVGAVDSGWDKFRPTTAKLRVGYIDLEQSEGIFFARLREFHPGRVRGFLRFAPPRFKLDAQGLAELAKIIADRKLDLLIIDTLARVRISMKGRSASDTDAELLDPVTKLAHESNCHIMIITHTGKRKDYDNPLDMIGSTSQLAAAVDDVLVLYKPQQADGELQRHLFVAGRHITEAGTYVIERTERGFNFHGEASEFVDGKAQKEILAVLRDVKKNGATPKEIGDVLGKSRNSVVKLLGKLERKNLVIRDEKSRYQLPGAAYREGKA